MILSSSIETFQLHSFRLHSEVSNSSFFQLPFPTIGGCLIWLRQTNSIETDMNETRGLLLRLIWLRRLNQSLEWYEWDTKLTVDTDMTETPWPKLAQIWLRRLKFLSSLFLSVSQSQMCRIEKQAKKIFGRLSHICASLGQGVSVISVSNVSLVSHSYHSKLWFKRLNHISLESRLHVSLISVSIGFVWRTHIRHPPISPNYGRPSIILPKSNFSDSFRNSCFAKSTR